MQIGAATVENSVEFPHETKNEPFDSTIPLPGLYTKNSETPNQKNLFTYLQ